MIITPQTIIQTVASGGGMVIDLQKHILIPNTMIQIAAAGRGRVIFEID